MWRDEVDAMCYAFSFPRLLAQAIGLESVGTAVPPSACPPTPIAVERQERMARLLAVMRGIIRQNGPLYFFLLRGWIGVAGTSVTSLRFFSLIFGVLVVALIYALGRRLLDPTAGVLAALLSALSPYLVWYSQEVKMYALLTALALLAIYALRRAVLGGGARWWVVHVITISLALYTHIWSVLLIPVAIFLYLVWWPESRRHWVGGLVSLALLTLPYLPLIAWEARHLFVPRDTGFPFYTLGNMAKVLLGAWSMGIGNWLWPWGTVSIVHAHLWASILGGGSALLGMFSAMVAGKARRQRSILGLGGWLVLPPLGIWIVSQWQPLFTDRYLIWVAPAFYLLMAAGLAFLWKHRRWPMLPLLLSILIVFVSSLWYQSAHPIKSDFRAAADFVARHDETQDLFIFQIPHARYTFDYYFPRTEYAWAEGMYTNHRIEGGDYLVSSEQVAIEMTHVTHEHERVWLIASEVRMWDRRELVQEWLEAQGTLLLEEHFSLVDVFLYELPR